MTGNAYQTFRRKFIEDCLRNPMRKCTKVGILHDLNSEIEDRQYGNRISVRTFDEDWRFVKEEALAAGIELLKKKEGKQCFYKYADPELSIFQEIKKSEFIKIVRAVHMLKQIKGIDPHDELFDVLYKLDTQVKYDRHNKKHVIDLQHVIASVGFEYVDDLYDAIMEETVIELCYQPFGEAARVRSVHAYYLKQYNGRWFLFGYDEQREGMSTFALDRIVGKIKGTRIAYKPSDGIFDADDYFRHIIGVTRLAGVPVEEVVLQFSPARAPYIETKSLHNTQEVFRRHDDGGITVRLQLIPNFELESLILSFGKDVTVLSPLALVDAVRKQLEAMGERYGVGV